MTHAIRAMLIAMSCLVAVSACTMNGNPPMQTNRSTNGLANGGGGGGGSGGY
jgi:hypothetical protein